MAHVRHLAAPVGLHTTATDAIDNLFERRVVAAHGHVVEKEQRFGSAAQHIVDAHGYQVDTDRVMAAEPLGHFELCSHAIGARYQDRLVVLASETGALEIELEEAGKATVVAYNAQG